MSLEIKGTVILIRQKIDLSLESGDYLVVNDSKGTITKLTSDQYHTLFGRSPITNNRKKIIKKYWTDNDKVILKHLQKVNKFVSVNDVINDIGFTPNRENRSLVQSRLKFMMNRGYVTKDGTGWGNVRWSITPDGKRVNKDTGEKSESSQG